MFLEAQKRFRDEENRLDNMMREAVADLRRDIDQTSRDYNDQNNAIGPKRAAITINRDNYSGELPQPFR